MPTRALNVTLQHLLADLRPDSDGRTDGELLARFVRDRDGDALAALVRRHTPMVWGVCRRLLRNAHDAEDAFQATFLVLVRKASAVPGQAVANWLYGVARQTAVRVRATAAKQRRRETQVVDMPELTVPEVRDTDLQSVVDEELNRLPGHYRVVVLLCDLEGMTRKEAARQLGIPEGSVASRLARARALLARRLTRRGVTLSGTVAAVLSAGAASAPSALVASTVKAATLLATGRAAVTGVISAEVAALTERTVKGMSLMRLKPILAALLLTAVALSAYGVVSLDAGGDVDKSASKSHGPGSGFVPAPEPPVPANARVVVKAVYLVGEKGGELSADDLKKHQDVRTVHSFTDLERLAGKKAAVWIDTAALPLLQGDKEREWVTRKAQEGYTFAMLGCNDWLCCFREKLDCFGIKGPGPVDWTKHELSPGFSVICLRREKAGLEVHVTGDVRGYKFVPTVEKVLNVTNRLLVGEAAPETP